MKKIVTILLILFLCQYLNAINVTLTNTTPFLFHANWEYAGDYFRRDIGPGQSVTVNSGLLFNGWKSSEVYIIGPHVGANWGINPETNAPLTFTQKMFGGANVYGTNNNLYWSSAQGIYDKFSLTIVPKKNPADNNNWWPSFEITQMSGTVFDPLTQPFEKAGQMITGVKDLLAHDIPGLIHDIQGIADNIKASIKLCITNIDLIGKAGNPKQVIEPLYTMLGAPLETLKTIEAPLDTIARTINNLGNNIVGVFDSKAGSDIKAVATDIQKIKTQIADMRTKIEKLLPILKASTLGLSDHAITMINEISATF